MRVIDIIDGTTVDGPGFRTSIYFAGCCHQCPGCHNPHTWDKDAGEEMSVADIMSRIEANDLHVTLSGGDPLYQDDLLPLLQAVRLSGRNLWCYTGYTYEHICATPRLSALLPYIDVLVDGPFVESLRDTSLIFKGSSNQRLIDIAASSPGRVVLWKPDTEAVI